MPTCYLPDTLWNQYADAIAKDDALCATLGIFSSPMTGYPGSDELLGYLGGQLNIWPEWLRATIEAG